VAGVVQTGYEFAFLGRFHLAGPANLEAKAHALHERLHALALEVIGAARDGAASLRRTRYASRST
jgi:hypothetical protein